MAYTSGYETLDNIVKTAIDMAEEDLSVYDRYLKLAIGCYRNLRLHHVRQGVIIAKLDVGDLNEVDFPEDMVDWAAIGIPINGKLWSFTRKHGLINTTSTLNGNEYYDTDIGEGQDIIQDTDTGYSSRGGVNQEGYYDIDYPNKRFILKNTTVTKVWLAYITSGIELDVTEHYIPIKYEEAMRAYIVWQSNLYRKDVNINFKRELERNYENTIVDLRNSEIDLNEIIDTIDELQHLQVRA